MSQDHELYRKPELKKAMSKIILLLAMIASLIAPPALQAGGLDKAQILNLYHDGEASYRLAMECMKTDPAKAKELFRKSVLSFERINGEGGIESGKLFYDIGNIYFRLGDTGRAVLNYRRAEKLMPHDMNLEQNLEYARSRCADKIEAKPETKVFKTLFFWHYDLDLKTRAIFFAIFFALVWVLAAVRLFVKEGWVRNCLIACAALSFLMGSSVGLEAFQQSGNRSGVIVAKEVIARKGDGTTFDPTFKEPLHAGTEFRLVEERRGWYYIELADGRRCWVPDSSAKKI